MFTGATAEETYWLVPELAAGISGSRFWISASLDVSAWARCAAESVVAESGTAWRWRISSKVRKANVLSFTTAPPASPPNWFRLKGDCGLGASVAPEPTNVGLEKLRASRSLFRRYSYASPCQVLFPARVA